MTDAQKNHDSKARKRTHILDTATGLFARHDFHEVTVDQIAEHAGYSKGTLYLYFKNKEDLFFQVAANGSDELCGVLERVTANDAPFAVQLRRACVEIGAFLRRRRTLFRLIQTEDYRVREHKGEIRRRWRAHRARLASAVEKILAHGAAEGVIRPDIPPDVLGRLLLGMIRAHARGLGESLNDKESVDVVLSLFLEGAGTAATGSAMPADAGGRT